MKYRIAFLLATSSIGSTYAQTDSRSNENQHDQVVLSQSTKTLVVNTTDITENVAESFKNELSNWEEKVISVHRDKSSHDITLVYNALLTPRELEDILKKYNIKSDRIISNK